MTQRILLALALLLHAYSSPAQKTESDSSSRFLKRIFLPSLDAGYQINRSDLLGNSAKFTTSIEYRISNNNDFFVRLNYDTYGARYQLLNSGTSNTIEGTVQVSDVLLAPGYRFGDNKFRIMLSVMPGIKFYEFPTASFNGVQFQINQEAKSVFTTSFLTTLEYYFDEKSAFTISLFENEVWQKVDFWEGSGSAVGVSLGFITSLL